MSFRDLRISRYSRRWTWLWCPVDWRRRRLLCSPGAKFSPQGLLNDAEQAGGRKYAELWPVITQKRDPLPEATERDGEKDKLTKYFSENPGEGS